MPNKQMKLQLALNAFIFLHLYSIRKIKHFCFSALFPVIAMDKRQIAIPSIHVTSNLMPFTLYVCDDCRCCCCLPFPVVVVGVYAVPCKQKIVNKNSKYLYFE